MALSWYPPFHTGATLGSTIEVVSRSGLVDLLVVPIGTQRAIAASVASGVYFVRVRTRTFTRALGAPSNELAVVVP